MLQILLRGLVAEPAHEQGPLGIAQSLRQLKGVPLGEFLLDELLVSLGPLVLDPVLSLGLGLLVLLDHLQVGDAELLRQIVAQSGGDGVQGPAFLLDGGL